MRNKILLALIIVILIGMAGYYLLGGFSEIELHVEDTEDIHLIGYEYRGTPQDDELGKTFQRIEDLLKAHPENKLNTIYYVEPAGKLDTMNVFVGTEYNERMAGDLEERIIPAEQIIVASLRSHRFVMPGPDKVKQKIEKFAKENNLETQGIYIDRIMGAYHVDVVAPLK